MEENDKSHGKYCYRYPHAALTADCVIFGFDGSSIKVLLVERGNEPYLGQWALPGGFMKIDETIEETARRELREETNLDNVYMEQFKTYSRVDRDPRERVVTVVFIALVRPADYEVIAGDDAANAFWFDEKMLPPLAFDHRQIVREAREHLKETLRIRPIAFELLNKYFSIGELQKVYEVINGTEYDRRNFMRSAIDSDVVREVKASPLPPTIRSARTQKLFTAAEEDDDDTLMMEDSCCCDMACEPEVRVDEIADSEVYKCRTAEPKRSEGSTKGLFDFLRKRR